MLLPVFLVNTFKAQDNVSLASVRYHRQQEKLVSFYLPMAPLNN